jgi:hypothetical protein
MTKWCKNLWGPKSLSTGVVTEPDDAISKAVDDMLHPDAHTLACCPNCGGMVCVEDFPNNYGISCLLIKKGKHCFFEGVNQGSHRLPYPYATDWRWAGKLLERRDVDIPKETISEGPLAICKAWLAGIRSQQNEQNTSSDS